MTNQPAQEKCPSCGSAKRDEPRMYIGPSLIGGFVPLGSYSECADPWHDEIAADASVPVPQTQPAKLFGNKIRQAIKVLGRPDASENGQTNAVANAGNKEAEQSVPLAKSSGGVGVSTRQAVGNTDSTACLSDVEAVPVVQPAKGCLCVWDVSETCPHHGRSEYLSASPNESGVVQQRAEPTMTAANFVIVKHTNLICWKLYVAGIFVGSECTMERAHNKADALTKAIVKFAESHAVSKESAPLVIRCNDCGEELTVGPCDETTMHVNTKHACCVFRREAAVTPSEDAQIEITRKQIMESEHRRKQGIQDNLAADYASGHMTGHGLGGQNPAPSEDAPSTPPNEDLVIEIARELYDRFVMGGWEPQDAYPQIREWLAGLGQ